MQNSKLLSSILKYLTVVALIFIATPISAAETSLVTKANNIAVGQQFQIDVFLNTEDEAINAVEGSILFPSELVELKTIKDGNSIINFWIESPRLTSNDQIVFSGITPGGFNGSSGLLFSMIVGAKESGEGTIEFSSITTLKNDGAGTAALTRAYGLVFLIADDSLEDQPAEALDTTVPEAFGLEIASDPSLFNGEYFLVFSAQDKETAIDHYEVKETRQRFLRIFSKWQIAKSPYLLSDQKLSSYVFVKAVDQAGNVRQSELIPQNPLPWFANYENWFIILIEFVIVYLLINFLWRKYLK